MSLSEQLHYAIDEVDTLSLSDDDVRHKNAFDNVMRAEELPDDPPRSVEYTAAYSRNVPESVEIREFWARTNDGAIAGMGEVLWEKVEENTHLIRAWVGVRPDCRSCGLGTALLRRIADVAAEQGRTTLVGEASERVPAARAFALRIGAEAALAAHTNRLLLSEVDRELVDRWITHGPARAPGYSLLAIDGPAPDEYLDEVVGMSNVMNTAPRGDLHVEDQTMLPSHQREWERVARARGEEWWALFARHDATGGFVGYTHVSYDPKVPHTVYQYGTAVRPEHRGHAIGKWLKATMLKRIMDERPNVIDVRTGNADSNDAMLGINYGLGFRPFNPSTAWQVKLETVREYLEGK